MAGLASSLLLLTVQYVILDCTKRTLRMVYEPYGPEMCRELCQDLPDTFYFVQEDLSCHRVSWNDSSGSIKNSLKHCLIGHRGTNHTDLTFQTGLNVCKHLHEGVYQPNQLHSEASYDRDLYLGQVSHNISLHQACADGSLCMVQFILSQRPADINTRDTLGRTPVMAAVMKNQISVFEFLVAQSCDLMAVDNNNDTVLHVACEVGNVDVVRKLVANHTLDIDRSGRMGRPPLMKSVLHDHRDVMDLLVSKACNVTTLDDNLNNVLHVACFGGHVDMVKYILRKFNCDIESRGEKGRTPLMIAAHSGRIAIFDFLVSNGSNLFVVDDYKDNILHVACTGGHIDMVQHILNKTSIDIESKAKYGRTPVMRTTEDGQKSVVDFLVSKQCNLTAVDSAMNTVLHVACIAGRLDMVKHILLKRKIPIDTRGHLKQTPLMFAVQRGHTTITKYLVREGCNLTILNKYGDSVLHLASMRGHKDIVKYILLQNKIPIDQRGQLERAPVMAAAYFGHKSVVMFLVSNGCKVRIYDKQNNNVLHVACMGGDAGIVKFIVKKLDIRMNSRGQFGRTPVMVAANMGQLGVVKYLVSAGCNLSKVDIHGDSILHVACIRNSVDMVKYIISQTKTTIDSRGHLGRSPVMVAANMGHLSVVKYLVSAGCNLSKVDIHGDSILHAACRSSSVDMVKYIVSQTKTTIDSRGHLGRSPVMTAAREGHLSIVKCLVAKGCNIVMIDNDKNNVLHLASMSGNIEIMKYICSQQRNPIDSRGQLGRTPVMAAATFGHKSVLMFLVNQGCKLTILDENRNNILHVACIGGHVNIVQYIVEKLHISIESRGYMGTTPVMTASCFGQTSVVKYLVVKGCKLTKLDVNRRNVLELACIRRHYEVVKYLMTIKSWSKTC